MRSVFVATVVLGLMLAPAFAKDALCFTTDDGEYPCEFVATGTDGSFEITAEGKPRFSLVMDAPGVAFGFASYDADGRNVALPGTFNRADDDPACWDNADTETRICAW